MSAHASQPDRLERLAQVRDIEKFKAHRGRPSGRPEAVRHRLEAISKRTEVPAELIDTLPPWDEVEAWTLAAHEIYAAGYSRPAIARAVGQKTVTVEARMIRYYPRKQPPPATT